MNKIISTFHTDVIIPPSREVVPSSIEAKFKVQTTPPRSHMLEAAQAHHEIVTTARSTNIKAEFAGYMKPLTKGTVKRVSDEQFNWGLMLLEDDANRDDLQMPGKVRRNFDNARKNNLFDTYCIAHAWIPTAIEANTTETALTLTETSLALLPPSAWNAMRSPTARRTAERLARNVDAQHQFNYNLLGTFETIGRTVETGTIRIVLGIAVLIAAIVAIVASVAALAVAAVVTLAVVAAAAVIAILLGAIALIGGGIGTVAVIDPIIYGVKFVGDENKQYVAMLYKIGQYYTE